MEYLTSHDIVWINTLVTGAPQPYNYIALESAMAGQYGYENSQDALSQAATFLRRLLFTPPFAQGNRRTALIATLVFLQRNGYRVALSNEELVRTLLDVERGALEPREAVEKMSAPWEPEQSEDLRTLVLETCLQHAEALTQALPGD